MIPRRRRTPRCYSRKPRASGDDPAANYDLLTQVQVNPARAGMIPCLYASRYFCDGKPRASGDDPPVLLEFPGGNLVNPARAGMIPG